MRRSDRTWIFALMAVVVSLALPVTAALGGQTPADDQYGGAGPPPSSPGADSGGDSPSGGNSSPSSSSDRGSDSSSNDSNPGGSRSGSSRNDRDCRDFSSQEDAQATYVAQSGDPDNLDSDSDGEACEEFDYGDTFDEDNVNSSDEYPRGGIASGGGSTAANVPSLLLPLLVSAGAFGLLATGSWVLTLRRRLGR